MCKINILHKIQVFISDYRIVFFYKLESYSELTDLEKMIYSVTNSDIKQSNKSDFSELRQINDHTSILAVTQHTILKHNVILTNSISED